MASKTDKEIFLNHIKEEASRIDIDFCLVVEGGDFCYRETRDRRYADPYVRDAIDSHVEFFKYNGDNKRTFKDFHDYIRKILSREIKAELIGSEWVLNPFAFSYRLPQYFLHVYQNGSRARLLVKETTIIGDNTELISFNFDCSGVRDDAAVIKLYFGENDTHTTVTHDEDIANGKWLNQLGDRKDEIRAVLMDILLGHQ